ncbi:cupin domain-containing protein [Actinocorallia longicatena]|uniref:Cupin type-2 domain-containing protein n=1 Tax=Actinocorallia longicatena TaxID=111803 RepID=A0ABP6Q015_9ACTN
MDEFSDPCEKRVAEDIDDIAPDGSEVRLLCRASRGSMAHFRLPAGTVARAVQHRSVEEVWFVVAGRGEIWRDSQGAGSVTELEPGLSLTIPTGVSFQFRAIGKEALEIVGVTMPPWPSGEDEAVPVTGHWPPTG